MVKPDGMFFLSTISKTPEAYLTNIFLGEYLLGLLPKGTHEYGMFMTKEQVMSNLSD
jgi:2-polyprenyl-6-hydroxyphenyl methylase/3-demethylubiquinone-9 3-methyltransferase